MKTQKPSIKITAPKAVHIVAWRKPRISYRIVKGSDTLANCNQGFERMLGLEKNLRAVASAFYPLGPTIITIYWVANRNSKTIIETSEVTV